MPQQVPDSTNQPPTPQEGSLSQGKEKSPDYGELVRFLVEPFLESPESLRVDCEQSDSRPKVWIRMAFDDPEKGRVFGRGGRNIQAVRTVLEATAKTAGQSIYLDIYGGVPSDRDRSSADRPSRGRGSRSAPRRNPPPRGKSGDRN